MGMSPEHEKLRPLLAELTSALFEAGAEHLIHRSSDLVADLDTHTGIELGGRLVSLIGDAHTFGATQWQQLYEHAIALRKRPPGTNPSDGNLEKLAGIHTRFDNLERLRKAIDSLEDIIDKKKPGPEKYVDANSIAEKLIELSSLAFNTGRKDLFEKLNQLHLWTKTQTVETEAPPLDGNSFFKITLEKLIEQVRDEHARRVQSAFYKQIPQQEITREANATALLQIIRDDLMKIQAKAFGIYQTDIHKWGR